MDERSWWVGLSPEAFYKALAAKNWDEGTTAYMHVQKRPRPQTAEKRRVIGKQGAAARWGRKAS